MPLLKVAIFTEICSLSYAVPYVTTNYLKKITAECMLRCHGAKYLNQMSKYNLHSLTLSPLARYRMPHLSSYLCVTMTTL